MAGIETHGQPVSPTNQWRMLAGDVQRMIDALDDNALEIVSNLCAGICYAEMDYDLNTLEEWKAHWDNGVPLPHPPPELTLSDFTTMVFETAGMRDHKNDGSAKAED